MRARQQHSEVSQFNRRDVKNKTLTYALIIVVACLWGYIAYRIFSAVTTKDDDLPQPVKMEKEAYNDYELPSDTTKLMLNYRDPFGILKPKNTVVTHSKNPGAIKITTLAPKPVMNWSFISYSGYIRNPATKKLVALISINGQSYALSEGESKSDVRLLRNLRDSIKISYQGKSKFIALKTAP